MLDQLNLTASRTRVAIRFDGRAWTYASLAKMVEVRRDWLMTSVPPGEPIVLAVPRSPDLVAWIVAAIDARVPYMAWDIAAGSETQLTELCNVLRPRALVGVAPRGMDFATVPPPIGTGCVSQSGGCGSSPPSILDGACYLLQTSGTTGQPKNVIIGRNELDLFLDSFNELVGISASDTILAASSVSFDISVVELVLPLAIGGTVLLASDEERRNPDSLIELLQRGVTVVQATPSMWQALLLRGLKGAMRISIGVSGGEHLHPELGESLLTCCDRLFSCYGPTETVTYSSGSVIDDANHVSLGSPLRGEALYLLDSDLRPVPVGVPGEVYIGGDGLSLGYFEDPAHTAARFIPNPFAGVSGAGRGGRMYRTGDRAFLDEEGRLRFLGRVDRQVKIRGHRTEPAGVEAVLSEHLSCHAAVVVPRAARGEQTELVAHVVVEDDCSDDDLRQWVSNRLPAAAMPVQFVRISEIPLTKNGKVDFASLASAPVVTGPRAGWRSPRSELESQLAELWCDVLNLDIVGIDDDFFEIGGHSLAAIWLLVSLADAIGVEVPVSTFFELRTIAALSEWLHTAQ